MAEGSRNLWLDSFAAKLGFGWLADTLPYDISPSYVYALVTITILEPVLNVWIHLLGGEVLYLQNPLFVLQPIAFIGAVYGANSLIDRYKDAMTEMQIEKRATDHEQLTDIVPTWLPWLFCSVGVVLSFARGLAQGPTVIYQDWGIPGLMAVFFVNPFVWTPIAAQFLAVYLAIEIIAPRRLATSDVGIHFLDPEGLGGLRPFGELVKHAYYYMVAGLVAFLLAIYGIPGIIPSGGDGPVDFVNIVFTVSWVGTIATVGFAVFTLHRFMHREKRRELHSLESELRELTDNLYDVSDYSVPPDVEHDVAKIRERMDIVSGTREYPATFSIWSQLLISIVLPKAVQVMLTSL